MNNFSMFVNVEFIIVIIISELTDFKARRITHFRKNMVDLAELELKHAKVSCFCKVVTLSSWCKTCLKMAGNSWLLSLKLTTIGMFQK